MHTEVLYICSLGCFHSSYIFVETWIIFLKNHTFAYTFFIVRLLLHIILTVRLLQSVSVCCAAVRFVIVALLFY